jgi:probable phosphoglycerate mutase
VTAPDLSAPHRLVLVRHGQTPHTVAQQLSGSGFTPEPALDEVGRAQAAAAAERLAWLGPFDVIIASPLLRTRQTAAIIAERLRHPQITTDHAWAEADFGKWEGLTVAEVVQRHPGAWERMIGDPSQAPPGGESLLGVRRRVLQRWEELAAADRPSSRATAVAGPVAPSRTTLVVTHLTPIRLVIAEAFSMPHAAFGRIIAAPGSISIVDRWADGGVSVVTLGERPFSGDQG